MPGKQILSELVALSHNLSDLIRKEKFPPTARRHLQVLDSWKEEQNSSGILLKTSGYGKNLHNLSRCADQMLNVKLGLNQKLIFLNLTWAAQLEPPPSKPHLQHLCVQNELYSWEKTAHPCGS